MSMHHALSRLRLRQALFGWIHFALAAPVIYLWVGLPLVMRQHGWSGTEIGLFQIAGLPAVFKLFLALPVQRWQPGPRPCLHWAWLTGAGYLMTLLGLAAMDADSHKVLLFMLTCLAALLATWADIPVNALAIQLFSPEERPLAGGVRSAVTFTAAIVGGGVMLLVQQAFGWAAPFFVMSGCLLSALALLNSVREDTRMPHTPSVQPLAVWSSFFQQTGGWAWAAVLLGHFPFVAAAWVYLKPLLLDRGFPVNDVALIVGIGGGALGALASLAAGFVPRSRVSDALPLSAAANAIALVLLAVAAAKASGPWLVACAALLAVVMGFASSLAFTLMMEFARSDQRAVDYGLQASLFTLTRITVALLAGTLLDRLGHPGMLAALALPALLFAVWAWAVRHKFRCSLGQR